MSEPTQPAPGRILAWEDDPGEPSAPRRPVSRPVPELGHDRLPIAIVGSRPEPGERRDAAALRWWTAAEALARGRDLWATLIGADLTWQPNVGRELEVRLDSSEPDLNAYYDRSALVFFHDTVEGVTVWSGESPDIVCHELGHAVLDALRPQLWDAAGTEPAALHEAFGDISALLAALELPSLRDAVVAETGGRPARSSRVSRLAERLGWAVRQVSPGRAEPTCLRDASNSWFYADPATLPPDGPVTQLSTEPHFFSRIFTGAALKAVAGMFALDATQDADGLQRASHAFGRMLVAAIRAAPVVPGYYSQVAAHMLEADVRDHGGRHQEALRSAFVRHGVLALASATAMTRVGRDRGARGTPAVPDGPGRLAELSRTTLPGPEVGLPGGLVVRACSQPERFEVAGAAPDVGPVTPSTGDRAAAIFVEDLLRRGRVDVSAAPGTVPAAPFAFKTHELEATGDAFILRRRAFDCGLHRGASRGR